jgi:hypothetical protein
MWLSELAFALFGRLDVFVLAALTDDVAVGIFAGAAQFAQNVTAIRSSFDPMVTAMVSQIHHANDASRLRRGFAHVWILVATLELPLVAFMIVGGGVDHAAAGHEVRGRGDAGADPHRPLFGARVVRAQSAHRQRLRP